MLTLELPEFSTPTDRECDWMTAGHFLLFYVRHLQTNDSRFLEPVNKPGPFCYVDDMIEAIYRLSQSNYPEPVNIGTQQGDVDSAFCPRNYSDIRAVRQKLSSKHCQRMTPRFVSPIFHVPPPPRGEVLNWEPAVDIPEGLNLTLNAIKSTS